MPEHVAREIGLRGRERVLRQHTSAHRALELERFIGAARRYTSSPSELAPFGIKKEEAVL